MEVSQEAFDALTARVELLETKYEEVLAKLDADAGVTDTNYAATQGVPGNDPKTVTNVTPALTGGKGFMVKIRDLSGKEYTLRPGEVKTGVKGSSAGMQSFVTKGYITVV